MDEKELHYRGSIEAILFAMGKAVEISHIANAIDLPASETKEIIEQMQEEYEHQNRGIQIIFLESKVQLCTRKDYYDCLIKIATQPKKQVLTEVLLETLSIIAYKQPVTKADIERIRGVKSDFSVNKLLEYGLIEEIGRLDTPGRPMLFATSEEFLRQFGLSESTDLPVLDETTIETFKEEAEEEIIV